MPIRNEARSRLDFSGVTDGIRAVIGVIEVLLGTVFLVPFLTTHSRPIQHLIQLFQAISQGVWFSDVYYSRFVVFSLGLLLFFQGVGFLIAAVDSQ
jgi:hypothetical protein